MSALAVLVGTGVVCSVLAIVIMAVVALSTPYSETPRWVIRVCGWLFVFGGSLSVLGVFLAIAMLAMQALN